MRYGKKNWSIPQKYIPLWYQNMESMKTLSLKLDDGIFSETEKVISRIKKSGIDILMKL